ncbi:MAG: hypothetical protein V4485_05450 [Pseudomonadota bacterium]
MISLRTSFLESSAPVRVELVNSRVAPAPADSSLSTRAPVDAVVVTLSQEAIRRTTMPTNEVPKHLKTIIDTIDKMSPADRYLDLHDKSLTDDDIIIICKHLEGNPRITSLDVSYNNIGPAGAIALARNTTITILDVAGNNISDAGAEALAQNETITHLFANRTNIGDAGVEALSQNKTIRTLWVSHNKIGDAGAEALAKNETLTTLNVSGNKIGDAGATALAENTTIEYLHATDNKIGPAGRNALFESATRRNLRRNAPTVAEVARPGATALAQNITLTPLNVSANNIGDDAERALRANAPAATSPQNIPGVSEVISSLREGSASVSETGAPRGAPSLKEGPAKGR